MERTRVCDDSVLHGKYSLTTVRMDEERGLGPMTFACERDYPSKNKPSLGTDTDTLIFF